MSDFLYAKQEVAAASDSGVSVIEDDGGRAVHTTNAYDSKSENVGYVGTLLQYTQWLDVPNVAGVVLKLNRDYDHSAAIYYDKESALYKLWWDDYGEQLFYAESPEHDWVFRKLWHWLSYNYRHPIAAYDVLPLFEVVDNIGAIVTHPFRYTTVTPALICNEQGGKEYRVCEISLYTGWVKPYVNEYEVQLNGFDAADHITFYGLTRNLGHTLSLTKPYVALRRKSIVVEFTVTLGQKTDCARAGLWGGDWYEIGALLAAGVDNRTLTALTLMKGRMFNILGVKKWWIDRHEAERARIRLHCKGKPILAPELPLSYDWKRGGLGGG